MVLNCVYKDCWLEQSCGKVVIFNLFCFAYYKVAEIGLKEEVSEEIVYRF